MGYKCFSYASESTNSSWVIGFGWTRIVFLSSVIMACVYYNTRTPKQFVASFHGNSVKNVLLVFFFVRSFVPTLPSRAKWDVPASEIMQKTQINSCYAYSLASINWWNLEIYSRRRTHTFRQIHTRWRIFPLHSLIPGARLPWSRDSAFDEPKIDNQTVVRAILHALSHANLSLLAIGVIKKNVTHL